MELSFSYDSVELSFLWFMELMSSPLASHIFFKLWGMCFRAPRCCPWEPNNYETLGRAPRRGQASGAQQRGWEGWCLTTSVLGSETALMVRPWFQRSGHCHAVDEMWVLGHTGAGQGKGGHACHQEDGPSFVWAPPCLGILNSQAPLCPQAQERPLYLKEIQGPRAGKAFISQIG